MKINNLRPACLLIVMIFTLVVTVSAAGSTEFQDSNYSSITGKPEEMSVYIVQLADEPLAIIAGENDQFQSMSSGLNKLDINSAVSAAYLNHLRRQQAQFLSTAENTLNRPLQTVYQYDVVYNGVALILTQKEADRLAKIPGVVNMQPDRWYQKQTDVTPDFIGATNIWDGSATPGPGSKGEGIIIGIIDTGIWPEHPSFADDGSYPAPVDWNGGCSAPTDSSLPYSCNNKLIGAKHFLVGYTIGAGGYDGLFNSARDDDGHGTHTASTAGGNEGVPVTLLGVDRGLISGIAPRAHIAAYKGLGPQGGVTSDLVAAINTAVADGVDVINYSIGGGASNPWTDPSAIAFRNARNAGVFVATSAGNAGPDEQTVGSPGNAPWLTTVGASTSNRHFISDITLSGPGTPPSGLYGASVTAGVENFNLVDAEGIADSTGDESGLCLNPFLPGTFEADDVVLCQRGQIARVLRGTYVQAGGGGGVILYNPEQQGLATDNYEIPAVHVENDIGQMIKDYLFQHPGEVTISFTSGLKISDADPRVTSDMMASFSSRGPNSTLLDVIKPDVTGPGVQILAGASPQHAGPSAQGQLFQAIQGTSMSSPHVAGAAALIKAVHPDWTPAEIESALMTTAISSHIKEDGLTPADPFDMGAGRIDLNNAALAALVMDETVDDYIDANPNTGGEPKELNNASLGNSNCVNFCSWTRILRNVTGETMNWQASVAGLRGSVNPASFALEANEEIELTIVVSAQALEAGMWSFGAVEIVPQIELSSPANVPMTRLPIAIIPDQDVETETISLETRRDAGSYLIEGLISAEITELTNEVYGLVPAYFTTINLAQDPTQEDAFDDLDQVWWDLIPVPGDAWRLVNEIRDSQAKDVDLHVGFDSNDNQMPDVEEEVCSGETSSWEEYCNISNPQQGNWWVLVQNWNGSDEGGKDAIILASAVVGNTDEGNMTIDGPSAVAGQTPFDVRVIYDLQESNEGQGWYGAFSLGTDAENPGNVAQFEIDLNRVADDVVKSADLAVAAPGDMINYSIFIRPNVHKEDITYQIEDLIPEGLTYMTGSAQASEGSVSVSGNELSWSGILSGMDSQKVPEVIAGFVENEVSINYKVTVDTDVRFGDRLVNQADSTTDQIGSKKETAEAPLFIGARSFFPFVTVAE